MAYSVPLFSPFDRKGTVFSPQGQSFFGSLLFPSCCLLSRLSSPWQLPILHFRRICSVALSISVFPKNGSLPLFFPPLGTFPSSHPPPPVPPHVSRGWLFFQREQLPPPFPLFPPTSGFSLFLYTFPPPSSSFPFP